MGDAVTIVSADGHRALLARNGEARAAHGLLWLPAMGVPARKYATFAEALAGHGIAVALHEWRGSGTSSARAARRCDWGYRTLLDDVAASRTALGESPMRWAIGGHSLGAQLGALALASAPRDYHGLAVVGAGVPYWRSFPVWQQPLMLAVFAAFRVLAAAAGHFPGETVGFAGREARGVVRDWTRSGLTGRYRIAGDPTDHDAALRTLATPLLAVRFAQDRYVPEGSLAALLARLPAARAERHELGPERFARGRADHFAWMRDPAPVAGIVAAWLARTLDPVVRGFPLSRPV